MSMVKVVMLGTGTCKPLPGGLRRAHPAILVIWDEGHLLFECSQCIAERLEQAGFQPELISNVAITHAHPDHFALPQFTQTCLCTHMIKPGFSWEDKEKYPKLNVYAPHQIIEDIPTLNRIHFPGEGTKGLPFPVLNLVDMTPRMTDHGVRTAYLSGGAVLKSASVAHDNHQADALAFRLEVEGRIIAYSGDYGFDEDSDTSQGVLRMTEGADLFISEASARVFDPESAYKYGHVNPEQAARIADEASAKRLALMHHSRADTNAEMHKSATMSGYRGEIVIAEDFDTYTI